MSVIGVQSFAQEAISLGARADAMAQATVSEGDVWSYYCNPGSLAILKKGVIASSYSNRFLLKELQSQSFVFVQPIKVGVFSFGASFNGFEVYRNLKIGMGYSLRLTEKMYAGIQLNYHRMILSNFYVLTLCLPARQAFMEVSQRNGRMEQVFIILEELDFQVLIENLPL